METTINTEFSQTYQILTKRESIGFDRKAKKRARR